MNRTPITAVHGMTPEEKFTGKKPDVSHLRVFGCIAYVHVLDEKKSKLDPKAEKCIFIGYSLEQKGYRCFNCRNPTLAKCGGEAQHLEKVRIGSPPGLPNVQSSTARPKTPRIEVFLVSLERS
jgi:hypothetical protein